MPYEQIYRLELVNFEGVDALIHISDTTSGTVAPPTYHDVDPAEVEVHILSSTGEKYGIKGKKLTFSFHPTDTINLNTFLDGDDDRWLVEMYVNSSIQFKGFLVLDDLREAFLDYDVIVVEMTASDNLALLKDKPLRKPDGTVPKGKFKMIEYMSWCLRATGQDLPINAIYNLFPEQLTDNTNHTFNFIYLEAMTFETQINEREDCYSVLEKLLRGCILTQEKGEWWILRIDEMVGSTYNYYQYSFDGTYIGADTITLTKDIGLLDSINPINKDGEINPERRVREVKLTYRLDPPREILCNIDFTRGDLITPLVIPGGAAYLIECWADGRNYVGSPTTSSLSPYIRRMFTNGYEEERLVVLPAATPGPNWIKSETLQVNQFDKFILSVDRKLTSQITGASGTYRDAVMHVRLYANNSTYWTLLGQDLGNNVAGDWIQTNSGFSSNVRVIEQVWNAAFTDETQWASISVEAKPVPFGGLIEVYLLQSAFGASRATHFQNLRFDYIPIIDGVYRRLRDQYHRVSTTDNLKAKVEEEVFISDSFNPNFKGAMFYLSGGNYLLTTRWYNFNFGTGAELGLERLGKYQVFELWNQHNRTIRKFQGSLLGIDSSTDIPGPLHQYTLTATSGHTTNKTFCALSYSQNVRSCRWGSAIFSDVYDSVAGKDFSATHEFKYTEQ